MKLKKIISIVTLCCAVTAANPTAFQTPMVVSATSSSKMPKLDIVGDYAINQHAIYDYIKKNKDKLGIVSFSNTAEDIDCTGIMDCLPTSNAEKAVGADKCVAEAIYKYAQKLGVDYKTIKHVKLNTSENFYRETIELAGKRIMIIWGRSIASNTSAAWAFPAKGPKSLNYRYLHYTYVAEDKEKKKLKKLYRKRLAKAEAIDPNETIEVNIGLDDKVTVNKRDYEMATQHYELNYVIQHRPPLVLSHYDTEENRHRIYDYVTKYSQCMKCTRTVNGTNRPVGNGSPKTIKLFENRFGLSYKYIMDASLDCADVYNLNTNNFYVPPENEGFDQDPLRRYRICIDGKYAEIVTGMSRDDNDRCTIAYLENDKYEKLQYVYQEGEGVVIVD